MKIELVGIAGSGKSTLANTLASGNSKIIKLLPPTTDKPKNYPFFAKGFLSLLPEYPSLHKKGERKLTMREIAWMAVINGWARQIIKNQNNLSTTILLDQGPIFLMTSLAYFGPSYLHLPQADEFWQPRFAEWGQVLDMVVFLDASNECLYQRIIGRQKNHVMKYEKREVVEKFLNDWREGYRSILNRITSQTPCPRILKIDTERVPIDRMCRLVKMEIINFNTETEKNRFVATLG